MNKELEHAIQHVGIHLLNNKNVQQTVLGGAAAAGTAVVSGATTVGGAVATGVSVAAGAVAAVVTSPVVLTTAAAVGVGIGVKKLFDWLDS